MESRSDDGGGLRALVVDDEPSLVRVVAGYLEREGFVVESTGDGESALAAARRAEPDVVVLDLGLPGIDGVETCRRLRTFSDCYVVMLTARADEVDMLIGLAVGADDYLTKPFSPRELVARIRTLLRRPREGAGPVRAPSATTGSDVQEQPPRTFGDLVIDPFAREVTMAGRAVTLTRTEFDLLDALSSRPRVVFTRRQLIDRVWGSEWIGDEHLVDIHLGHGRWSRFGLAPRLFVTDLLVMAAGAGTLLAVAPLIAPALFHSQLHMPTCPRSTSRSEPRWTPRSTAPCSPPSRSGSVWQRWLRQ